MKYVLSNIGKLTDRLLSESFFVYSLLYITYLNYISVTYLTLFFITTHYLLINNVRV